MIERQYKAKILIKNRNLRGEVLEELVKYKTYKIKSLFRLSDKEVKHFIIDNNHQSKFVEDTPTIEVLKIY